MSVKQKQLVEYATQDLVAILVERAGKSIQDAMSVVYHSRLHEKLQDVETGLYLEGSEYLYGLLMEELARCARVIHARANSPAPNCRSGKGFPHCTRNPSAAACGNDITRAS